jgi:hypothetical protein
MSEMIIQKAARRPYETQTEAAMVRSVDVEFRP